MDADCDDRIHLCDLCVVYVFKSFTIWSQILSLEQYSLQDVLNHPRGLRFLLVWPILKASEALNMSKHELFGFAVAFNIALTSFLMARAQSILTRQANRHWTSWFCFYFPVFAMLSMTMNGRLSFMLLGSSIMLLSCSQWLALVEKQHHPLRAIPYAITNAIGLLLMTVSSGTFSVGVMVLLLFSFALCWISKRGRLIHGFLSLISVLPFLGQQYLLLSKNLDYYDGSYTLMLLHGPGKILFFLEPPRAITTAGVAVIAFGLTYLALSLLERLQNLSRLLAPLLFVFCAIVIGIFGYSALLTGLCASVLLLIHFICISGSSDRAPIIITTSASGKKQHLVSFIAALAFAIGTWNFLPADWSAIKIKAINQTHEAMDEAEYFSWLMPQSLYPDAQTVTSLSTSLAEDRLHYSLGLCTAPNASGFHWLNNSTLRWYRLDREASNW